MAPATMAGASWGLIDVPGVNNKPTAAPKTTPAITAPTLVFTKAHRSRACAPIASHSARSRSTCSAACPRSGITVSELVLAQAVVATTTTRNPHASRDRRSKHLKQHRPSDSADRRGSKTGGVTLSLWLDEAAFGNLSKRLCRLYQSQLDSVLNHRYRRRNEKIGVQKKPNEVSRARKHLKLNNHILNIPAPDVSLCYDDVRTRRHVHSGVSVIPQ